MRFLFSVVFYPDYNANTVCCENLANYFKERGHQVDFLALKKNSIEPDYEIINGSNVIRLNSSKSSFLSCLGMSFSVKDFSEMLIFSKLQLNILKYKKKKFKTYETSLLDISLLDSKEAYSKILKVRRHYDYLLAISSPFYCVILSNELMKMGLVQNWSPILLDAYVYNKCMFVETIGCRKSIAERVFLTTKRVFMTKGIKDENLRRGYNPYYHRKTTEIYIPMMKDMKLQKVQSGEDNIPTLIYAGVFYRYIRNPEKMMDLLSKIKGCKIKFYSENCEDVIDESKNKFNESELLISGRIGHDECLQEIASSDILINLGNAISNQTPSKIFEYVSMGMPILNFYFIEEDLCLPILRKYPLALNINVNNYTEDDIQRIETFIKENKGKRLSFKEATKDLVECRLDSVAEIIYREILKD